MVSVLIVLLKLNRVVTTAYKTESYSSTKLPVKAGEIIRPQRSNRSDNTWLQFQMPTDVLLVALYPSLPLPLMRFSLHTRDADAYKVIWGKKGEYKPGLCSGKWRGGGGGGGMCRHPMAAGHVCNQINLHSKPLQVNSPRWRGLFRPHPTTDPPPPPLPPLFVEVNLISMESF